MSVTAHPEMGYCSGPFRFNHMLKCQLGLLHMHLTLLNKIMAERGSKVPAYYNAVVIKNHQKMETPEQIINWVGHWDNGHKLGLSQAN